MSSISPKHSSRTEAATSFSRFTHLAPEIQLLIWEQTWPAARIIEPALFDYPETDPEDEDFEGPDEVVNLRLAGTFSTMIKYHNIGSRIVDQRPAEKCNDPIALQVCHTSRNHALRQYRLMSSLGGNFYFSPERDIFSFGVDFSDDYDIYMPFLEQSQHDELNLIQTVVLSDALWPDKPRNPKKRRMDDRVLDCLSHLGGLQTVKILLQWPEDDTMDLNDEDQDEVEEEDEEDEEGEEDRSDEEDKEDKGKVKCYMRLAGKLRDDFPALMANEKCTATRIEVIDMEGTIY